MTARVKILGVFAVALLGVTLLWPANEVPAGPPEGGEAITSANWGARTGFAPDLTNAPPKGTTINEGNLEQWKQWVALGIDTLVQRYKLKLKVSDYEPIHPSTGYVAATNQYLGQPRLLDTGGDPRKMAIADYTAGLPFPQPKTGTEVAYNYHFAYSQWPTVEFDADLADVVEIDKWSGKEVSVHDDSPDMDGLQLALDAGEGRLFLMPAK